MPSMRDHQGIVLEKFNGLYSRGSTDTTPLDHFADCNNIKYIDDSSFRTRDGIGITQDVLVPLRNIKRIYNYPTQTGNTFVVLTNTNAILPNLSNFIPNFDDEFNETNPIFLKPNNQLFLEEDSIDSNVDDHWLTNYPTSIDTVIGNIYHVINPTLVYGPILSIYGMTDFAFLPYAGRGYISPFSTFDVGGLNVEKGLPNEFLYVYAGNGTPARQAAGQALAGALTIANGAAGHTDAGFHLFGFVSESISGYLSPPGAIGSFTTIAGNSVSFGTVPASGDPNVVKRHLVVTKVITGYNGNPNGYIFYFIPSAVINNNTDNFLNNVSFYDAELLADASHLFNNYSQIPAGAALSNYHNRLSLFAPYTDISIGLISSPGEPEAINQINGLIVVPLDGNPITNAQELRDVFYVFKRSRTVAFIDSGDVPSSWPMTVIDNALGTSVHGIATVLDSGSSNVDFLIIATYQGISLFNGRYITPELSWKIEAYWRLLSRADFRFIQIINAPIQKEIYIILPSRNLLVGNYSNGMDQMKIRWSPWSFVMGVNTVAIWNIDEIILGADEG
jgi:hypothetical protein